nr:ulp1 protease family, C-terminal catalytic domain-containing protein [Tanacetum cinerariifolium]
MDNVGDDDDENGDDDENRDDDGGNVNNDVNDCDVNGDSEDVNEGNEAEEAEIMSTLENFTQCLTKATAMTILDNSPGTYDSKYKEICDLLLFARHLKQYGHIRHTEVVKVKHTIPKLKWKTKENFHDCGIVTMLHMETFDGGPASNLECGLPVESQLQRDILRRLRFKFATKILLHEINVHAGKMLE